MIIHSFISYSNNFKLYKQNNYRYKGIKNIYFLYIIILYMISILVPIYNGINFIDDSISSIVNQTYKEWELLIGINGHQENSDIYNIAINYINKYKDTDIYSKIKVFDFYNIKGKSNTLNEMIKYCKYDYIALLDVDDIWRPIKLETQVQYIKDYDVVGSRCIYFGESKNGIIPDIPVRDISTFNFFTFNPIINSSIIIKKEFAKWNENGIEDYDLWLTLRKMQKKFYNCPEILVKHRIHNDSAFNSKGNHMLVSNLLKKHSNSYLPNNL